VFLGRGIRDANYFTESFSAKLKSSLQIDESVSVLNMNAEELGLDSLVAVDIRSWFVKELNVEMPVLKILGGYTVAELVSAAKEQLPESFTPNLGQEIDPALKAAAKKVYQAPETASAVTPANAEVDYAAYDEEDDDASDSSDSALGFAQPREQLLKKPNKLKEVAFQADIDTPPKTSSSSDSFISDSENDSLLKSRISTATSVSVMDEYFSTKDDVGLERVVSMSFGQARFWFLKSYLEDQTTFNITTSIRLSGRLNIDSFQKAVKAVGRRHEGLRTSFFMDRNNQPMQGVLRRSPLHLEHIRVSSQEAIELEYAKIKNHRYDIGSGETIRISLLSLADDLHQLIIGYHHINMDGMSLEVILRDIEMLYYNRPLAPVPLQYPDFAKLQRKEHLSGKWHKELAFWKKEFADIPAPLPILPLSKTSARSPLTSYSANTVKFKIDAATSAQIQNACKRTKTSPFNFYIAAFKTLLYRFSKATDISIGMADGGRNNEAVSDTTGFFLNLLPLRFHLDSTQTFMEALKEARSKVVSALANSKVPFDVILNEVNAPRTATHNPLFQAFINYRQGVQDKRHYCGCDSEATQFDGSRTAYDISIDILANPGSESTVFLSGQGLLYSEADVEVLAQSYHTLIKSFARNPAARLSRPPLYDPEETQRALDLGVGPSLPPTWPKTLVHRLDEITSRFPSNIALVDPRNRLTYSQMAERVNSIASTLKANNIGKGARVGVFQNPASDFICTLLAVLRVGAVFVPLELRLLPARLAMMVADSHVDAIVYDKANQKDLAALGSGFQKVNVSLIPPKSSTIVPNEAEPESTAIIIYTSGSTGKPKGILLSHASCRNQVQGSTKMWDIPFGTGVHIQQSSWSFDISISQTFVALENGASLYIVPKEKRGDALAMAKTIVSEGITHIQATPSEFVGWLHGADLDALRSSNWRLAMSAGEKMTPALFAELRKLGKSDLALINGYGPAETTLAVASTYINYQQSDDLSKPLDIFPNYSVYILDADLRPVPTGTSGEIFIGGAGVAAGYLNLDNVTKERFLPDDFAPAEFAKNYWVTMHRSGDRGRIPANGGLVLEGRVEGDTQIKLGGIRIELNDVESTIVQHSNGDVHDAVVSLRSSGETEFLVAHIVLTKSFSGDKAALVSRLQSSLPLPQYMRPTMVIIVDSLPTNYSGKLDRKAVRQLPLQVTTNANRSTTEQQKSSPQTELINIWKQVLGEEVTSLHRIDSDTDFFHIGGTSLALIKVQGLVKSVFGVEVPVVQLFEHSTLNAMVKQISPPMELPLHQESDPLEQLEHRISQSNEINWEKETELTDDIYEAEINATPKDQGLGFKTVVITGASGFLGKEILRQMIDDVHIDKIHAIALRRHKSDLPAIFSHPKVHVQQGNLNAPRLGLTEAKAKEIFAETDAVIHNGSDVSFLKTYQTLSKTNLGSTRELVKLCLGNRVPIHFISSASVAHLSGKPSFGEESVSSYPPPRDGSDGYTASKWASERFLELVGEKFSLPIWVHRPSSVTGPDAPQLDLMTNMLHYSKLMRKVPLSSAWTGTLDFVSVDTAAYDILKEVKNDSANPDGGMVRYVYESGDVEIDVKDMQTSLEKQTGDRFEVVDVDTWARETVDQGLDELVAAYLRMAADAPIVFPKLLHSEKRVRFDDAEPAPKTSGFSLRSVVGRWLWSQ